MRLPRLSIDNFQFVIMLLLLALLTGIVTFMNMPRSEDPSMDGPYYNISVVFPGTSPKDMEELIVNPLEEELNELEDITKIWAKIKDGLVDMYVEGEYGIDYQSKLDEISGIISSLQPTFPDGVVHVHVGKWTPMDLAIMQLALVSEVSDYGDVFKEAERLEGELEKIKGVRGVKILAYPKKLSLIHI